MSIHSDRTAREEVAAAVKERTGLDCTEANVLEVARYGSVEPGTVSDEHDEALSDAITNELDERGIAT
jgi:hypothetical protein